MSRVSTTLYHPGNRFSSQSRGESEPYCNESEPSLYSTQVPDNYENTVDEAPLGGSKCPRAFVIIDKRTGELRRRGCRRYGCQTCLRERSWKVAREVTEIVNAEVAENGAEPLFITATLRPSAVGDGMDTARLCREALNEALLAVKRSRSGKAARYGRSRPWPGMKLVGLMATVAMENAVYHSHWSGSMTALPGTQLPSFEEVAAEISWRYRLALAKRLGLDPERLDGDLSPGYCRVEQTRSVTAATMYTAQQGVNSDLPRGHRRLSKTGMRRRSQEVKSVDVVKEPAHVPEPNIEPNELKTDPKQAVPAGGRIGMVAGIEEPINAVLKPFLEIEPVKAASHLGRLADAVRRAHAALNAEQAAIPVYRQQIVAATVAGNGSAWATNSARLAGTPIRCGECERQRVAALVEYLDAALDLAGELIREYPEARRLKRVLPKVAGELGYEVGGSGVGAPVAVAAKVRGERMRRQVAEEVTV